MSINYFLKWKYNNAPEGEKPLEKVVSLSKYGLVTGIGVGIYDCIFISQTFKFWDSVRCLSFWTFPMTAMCATFASVAYTTTKLRGEDGYANYLVATLATSGVLHHWQKNGRLTFPFTILLGALATIKKDGDLKGYNPFPLDFEIRDGYGTLPFDWTLKKDPRGRRPWE